MLKKRYILVAGVVGGFAVAALVFAETAGTATSTAWVQAQRQSLKAQIESEREAVRAKVETEKSQFEEMAKKKLKQLNEASKDERAQIQADLKTERVNFRESVKMEQEKVREDAQQLRDDFRANVKSDVNRARIAVAHAQSLRMLNRYRAAIERLGHLTARLGSRVEKLQANGVDVSSVTPLIDEAKNMKVTADADLQAMQSKYEDLLKGDNTGGIADEAKAIAADLKTKIETFQNKLKDIVKAIRALAPTENEQDGDSSDVPVTATNAQ